MNVFFRYIFIVGVIFLPLYSYAGNSSGPIDTAFISDHGVGSGIFLKLVLDDSGFSADCPFGAFIQLVDSSGDSVDIGQTFKNYIQAKETVLEDLYVEYDTVSNYFGTGATVCEITGVK